MGRPGAGVALLRCKDTSWGGKTDRGGSHHLHPEVEFGQSTTAPTSVLVLLLPHVSLLYHALEISPDEHLC